jgi:hypothetical protein
MTLTAGRLPGLRLPTSQGFLREPDRQAASISQRCVIVPPVRHPMPLTRNVVPTFGMKLERHDRSPRQPRQTSASTLLKKDPTTLSVQQSRGGSSRPRRLHSNYDVRRGHGVRLHNSSPSATAGYWETSWQSRNRAEWLLLGVKLFGLIMFGVMRASAPYRSRADVPR